MLIKLSNYLKIKNRIFPIINRLNSTNYVQGQRINKTREYFYYIDHEGMLFLDDARIKNFTSCFKDKKFLVFFFNRIRINETERYRDEFPYISLCGVERNYIRCDDVPIVYTHLIKTDTGDEKLSYGNADQLLMVDFLPENIWMNAQTGRVYYPTSEQFGSIGLIKSKLAIELSRHFIFDNGEDKSPTKIVWNGKEIKLNDDWIRAINYLRIKEIE